MDRNRQTRADAGWRVLKFGGSSVRDAGRIRAVARIVEEAAVSRGDRIAVVVSALGGATDALLNLARSANSGDPDLDALANQWVDRHLAVAQELGGGEITAVVAALGVELRAALAACSDSLATFPHPSPSPLNERRLVNSDREARTARDLDLVMSFGERTSAPLVAEALRQRGLDALSCDLRSLVRTSDHFGAALVEHEATTAALRQHFSCEQRLLVATGFLGSTADGHTTTLGRGGSDLTAALLGVALEATEVEIWTDVDGVKSADPRLVADAFSIPALSYEEIMELAHFGAKVVYPPTVAPARRAGIPLRILNTLDPSFAGTLIGKRDHQQPVRTVTGITSISNVVLLQLEGSGLAGVTGIAERFFGALARASCNVILISQASSEHSICCAIAPDRVEAARQHVALEFQREQDREEIQPLVIETEMSVVAVVGEGMRERPGVAAAVFAVLAENNVNVHAIAQGSSELNISVVVHRQDEIKAVRSLHGSLFEDRATALIEPVLEVIVAGIGGVGSELLALLTEDPDRFRVIGVMNSTCQLFGHGASQRHSDTETWRERLERDGEPVDPLQLVRVARSRGHRCVLVDCTASASLPSVYPDVLRHGAAIVAANKIGIAADLAGSSLTWQRRGRSAQLTGAPESGSHPGLDSSPAAVSFEATVGAGLPILSTLRTLLESGDRIIELSGVFSGTLGFVLARLRAGSPLSTAVRDAFERGYTEPDPRADLSGLDVARKLLILARLCAVRIDLADISVEPLIAVDQKVDLASFWRHLQFPDDACAQRLVAAQSRGATLAYLASISLDHPESAAVGLQSISTDHPAAQLQGTDNLFSIRTERYDQQPLIIRGPGAGTRVTAAGVMADLLALHKQQQRRPLLSTRPSLVS